MLILSSEPNLINLKLDLKLSTYRRIDLYQQNASHPSEFCSNFVCEKSGLSEIQITQFIESENEARNEFANRENISNTYSVEWSSQFAEFARKKVQLCLHPTSQDQVILETDVIKEWFPNSDDTKNLAVEVVIAMEEVHIGNSEVLMVYTRVEEHANRYFGLNHFNHRNALHRRGATLQMGCDYLVRNNGTHIIMHLVCVYGLLYFNNGFINDYTPAIGSACSRCNFYDIRPFYRTNNVAEVKWACDPPFPYLCADLSTERWAPFEGFRYQCDRQSTVPRIFPTSVWVNKTSIPTLESFGELSKWPCFHYAVPLVVLTVILILVIIYQVYRLVVFKKTRKSGLYRNKSEKP